MHRYPQNHSYVGSSGQTLTKNVPMTLCNWQICHQTHALRSCTTFALNQIRYQIHTVATPAVAGTRAYLLQGINGGCYKGGGGAALLRLRFCGRTSSSLPRTTVQR